MDEPVDIRKIARYYGHKWNYHYVKSKLRTDPLYGAVFDALGDTTAPLLDLGCGLGLLAFYLRERGFAAPIRGIDYDARKIETARKIATAHYTELEFEKGDAREGVPDVAGNVTILDILQFFRPDEQARLLTAAAVCVTPGGKLVIRSGLRDRSWRFRATHMGDLLAKATFWMKSAPVHYPTRDSIESVLAAAGLEGELRPLWGRTPFNNYLGVFFRGS